jgi:hypothetical protein
MPSSDPPPQHRGGSADQQQDAQKFNSYHQQQMYSYTTDQNEGSQYVIPPEYNNHLTMGQAPDSSINSSNIWPNPPYNLQEHQQHFQDVPQYSEQQNAQRAVLCQPSLPNTQGAPQYFLSQQNSEGAPPYTQQQNLQIMPQYAQ